MLNRHEICLVYGAQWATYQNTTVKTFIFSFPEIIPRGHLFKGAVQEGTCLSPLIKTH